MNNRKYTFYIGQDTQPVKPGDKSAEAYFAQCVCNCLESLDEAKDENDIVNSISIFIKSMKKHDVTRRMIHNADEGVIQIALEAQPLPDKDYFKSYILGLEIPDRGYLTIEETPAEYEKRKTPR